MKQHNDEQRKIELLKWFLENNFFNQRIEYYMKRFEIISKIDNIIDKRDAYLKFQTDILNEFDNMVGKKSMLM